MFGGKKTPEEKHAEKARKKAELQKKIDELNAKKGKGKSKSKTKSSKNDSSSTFIRNKKMPDVRQEPLSKAISQSRAEDPEQSSHIIEGVVKLRKPTRKTKSQLLSQQELRQKANQIIQSNRYKEIIARLSDSSASEIAQMLYEAKDIFQFYQAFMNKYNNYEVLIAIDALDKTDVELFQYVIRNKIIDEMYQGDIDLYNNIYMQEERNKFLEFKESHKDLSSIQNVLEDYLPHIYLLGSQINLNELEMMSLPTQVTLLQDTNSINKFANDQDYKVVLLFQEPIMSIIKEYIKVKDTQDFPIYSAFDLDSIPTVQRIVPFNRANLIKKIALG